MRVVVLLLFSSLTLSAAQINFRDNFESGMRNWLPPRPADWQVEQEGGNHFLRLLRPGYGPGVPRRPLNYALLRDRCFGDFTLSVRLRRAGKSLTIVFGYQDTLHFNYAHLSVDRGTEQKVHNGIFRVDGGERFRIDNPDRPPALPDKEWHTARIVRQAPQVDVYMDGSSEALLSVNEKLFPYGRVGIGSFDESGDFDDFQITGTPSNACNSVDMKLPALADTALTSKAAAEAKNHGTEQAVPLGPDAFALLDFPGLRQWPGYAVKQAVLFVHAPGQTAGEVRISTVKGQWDEKAAPAGLGLAWKPAAAQGRPEGWLAIPVEPALARSMMSGESTGLALAAGQPLTIDSRETQFIPYLQLILEFNTKAQRH